MLLVLTLVNELYFFPQVSVSLIFIIGRSLIVSPATFFRKISTSEDISYYIYDFLYLNYLTLYLDVLV